MKEIDTRSVQLDQLNAWFRANGWQSRRTKAGTGVVWSRGAAEVLTPVDLSGPDSQLRLRVAIEALAEIDHLTVDELVSLINTSASDLVEWRVIDRGPDDDGLGLALAESLLSTVKRVVVVSAASVEHRRGYFGRRISRRSRAVASVVRLGQTKRGSFIVPLINDVGHLNDGIGGLDMQVELQPLARQALVGLATALKSSLRVASTSQTPTVQQVNQLVSEGVSFELSTAIADLLENESLESLEVAFTWASGAPANAESIRLQLQPSQAEFFRRVASSLFESNEIGLQRIFARVSSLSRHKEAELDGGVVQFRREITGGTSARLRAELNETMYQTALAADSRREAVMILGRIVEEAGHQSKVVDVVSVERSIQLAFDGD